MPRSKSLVPNTICRSSAKAALNSGRNGPSSVWAMVRSKRVVFTTPPVRRSQNHQSSDGAKLWADRAYSAVIVSMALRVPSNAYGACRAPVLIPVTRSKRGIASDGRSRQPRRNPVPNAPFCPPPDSMSTSTVRSPRFATRRTSRSITVSRRARCLASIVIPSR